MDANKLFRQSVILMDQSKNTKKALWQKAF